jgi:tyrosinase
VNNQSVNDGLNGDGLFPSGPYRLFTQASFSNYAAFATKKYQRAGKLTDFASLESVHDNVHGDTGGTSRGNTGHMGHVPVAAFEPLFWLHHW